MSHTAAPTAGAGGIEIRIPIREILPWIVFVGLLAMIVLYFVSTEQGAASVFSGSYLHEFLHDGRHLLAFPCH
ncbi:MAG TPA: CbtB-domain containing protein [Amycolatopsis sp.]|nr:CbtB-domain containing protein [Amycolatopsis sp.]